MTKDPNKPLKKVAISLSESLEVSSLKLPEHSQIPRTLLSHCYPTCSTDIPPHGWRWPSNFSFYTCIPASKSRRWTHTLPLRGFSLKFQATLLLTAQNSEYTEGPGRLEVYTMFLGAVCTFKMRNILLRKKGKSNVAVNQKFLLPHTWVLFEKLPDNDIQPLKKWTKEPEMEKSQ